MFVDNSNKALHLRSLGCGFNFTGP